MSHSLFSFNPAISFGIIALHNGLYTDMHYFVKKAIDAFQPVFDRILEDQTRRLYGGTWVAEDSEVVLTVSDGSLWVTKMIVKGKNVLSAFWGTDKVSVPLTLWSAEREDEFRYASLAIYLVNSGQFRSNVLELPLVDRVPMLYPRWAARPIGLPSVSPVSRIASNILNATIQMVSTPMVLHTTFSILKDRARAVLCVIQGWRLHCVVANSRVVTFTDI